MQEPPGLLGCYAREIANFFFFETDVKTKCIRPLFSKKITKNRKIVEWHYPQKSYARGGTWHQYPYSVNLKSFLQIQIFYLNLLVAFPNDQSFPFSTI